MHTIPWAGMGAAAGFAAAWVKARENLSPTIARVASVAGALVVGVVANAIGESEMVSAALANEPGEGRSELTDAAYGIVTSALVGASLVRGSSLPVSQPRLAGK
jgi:hypothetical protein